MMILNTLLLALAPLAPDTVTEWDAPGAYIAGSPFDVTVTIKDFEQDRLIFQSIHPAPASMPVSS